MMSKEKFRFNPFLRFFTLFVGTLAISYGVYAILVFEPVGRFKTILPYVVVLLAANSVFRNLFTLNSITLTSEKVIFKKLALPSFQIPLQKIAKMSFVGKRMSLLKVSYYKEDVLQNYTFNLGFPAVLDALSEIKKINPQIEFEGDLGKQI